MLGMCRVKDSYSIRKLSSEVFDPLVASRLQLSYEHAPVEEISVSHELETRKPTESNSPRDRISIEYRRTNPDKPDIRNDVEATQGKEQG
jgi:hypothetical protein